MNIITGTPTWIVCPIAVHMVTASSNKVCSTGKNRNFNESISSHLGWKHKNAEAASSHFFPLEQPGEGGAGGRSPLQPEKE